LKPKYRIVFIMTVSIIIAAIVVVNLFLQCTPTKPDCEIINSDDYYFTVNDDALTVTSYCGDENADVFTVPAEFEGLPVKAIADKTFLGDPRPKEILLPDGLEEIGFAAFRSCYSLEKISIPESVTHIGNCCLEYCHSLKEVALPSGLEEIGTAMFRSCYSLENIDIPDTVTSIGEAAFDGCITLKEIDIPDGVATIAPDTFRNCRELESIKIPNSVTSIKKGAFENCLALTSIYVPESVTEIDARAFDAAVTIQANADSYAIEYAIQNGINYEEM